MRVWRRQAEMLLAVASVAAANEGRSFVGMMDVGLRRKVACRSGHKVGKSTTAAILALWWWCTRVDARVVMTSATARQIKSILWKELRKDYDGARWRLGGTFARDPETGVQLPDGREIVGFSTNEPEKMAGISSPALLYLCDEASGIPDEIFEAIEGNAAGGAIVVLFSNPTKTAGQFFRAFHDERDLWIGIQISSEEAAKVDPPIPGLARAEWIDEKKRQWGEDSPLFAVRVKGDFPRQGEHAIVALHVALEAVRRWKEAFAEGRKVPTDPLEIGVDVARYGADENVIVWRRGLHAGRPIPFRPVPPEKDKARRSADQQVADAVLEVARTRRRRGERALVRIDVTGLGAAVFALLEQAHDIDVLPIHAQDTATLDDEGDAQFHRRRDELWWSLREWFADGGEIPDDPELLAEVLAPEYKIDPGGKIRVSSKDEIRKVIKRSPDRADALCLAVFDAERSNAREVIEDATAFPKARFAREDKDEDGTAWDLWKDDEDAIADDDASFAELLVGGGGRDDEDGETEDEGRSRGR